MYFFDTLITYIKNMLREMSQEFDNVLKKFNLQMSF